FAAGILALANAGCRVICDYVSYFAEPFYQTGVVGNAIQTVEQEGVIYLTSAGNRDAVGYQAAWNPIQTATVGSTVLHDTQNFGNGSPTAVGAVDAENTPGLGGTLQSENFSATGAGTQLWFNNDGS